RGRDFLERVIREIQSDAFRLEQRRVLFDEGILRFRENADEILFREGTELDTDRKPALEFRDQIGWLGDMKGAGRDEQNMVRFYRAILGRDRGAFDDREQVALDAFA